VNETGKYRVIDKIMLIVNPVDYLKKIMPATTIRAADGTYVNNVFPYPTVTVQSIHVNEGEAIIGISKRYFMGIGTANTGKIEYSDDYKFLEDERVYLVKLYGHGQPLDDKAFLYCDISDLKPAYHKVFVANTEGEPLPVYPIYDARLSQITIGELTLAPIFNKSTHSYNTTTSNATNTITAIAKDGDAEIEILLNGVELVNGTSATWEDGDNTVEITVTSGTESETYTVTVVKS
jgi:hypothetical protein